MTSKSAAKEETETTTAIGAEPEGWRPEEGDVLSGTIEEIGKAWSEWTNSNYPLLTVQTSDGRSVNVHCFHHTLRTRLMEIRPRVGSEIEISYLGKRTTKDGKRSVAVYKVKVPGDTGEGVWNDLSVQDRRAAAMADPDVPADMDDDIPF